MASKTINFSLTVTVPPDWFLAINPTNLSVAQGTLATFNVTASAQGGFAGSIALSLSGLPAGVTPTITPSTIAQNGTAVISIPTANIPVGTVALVLTGTVA